MVERQQLFEQAVMNSKLNGSKVSQPNLCMLYAMCKDKRDDRYCIYFCVCAYILRQLVKIDVAY